jgi:hypothetical protein
MVFLLKGYPLLRDSERKVPRESEGDHWAQARALTADNCSYD